MDTKPGTDRTAVTPPSVGDLAPLVTSFVRHLRAANKSEQTSLPTVTRPTGCPRSWPAAGCRPERTLMRSRPLPIDFVRFPCSRPRRHRHADRLQWFMAEGPKLEQSPHRNRKTGAAFQRDDLFAFSLLAPHLTAAFQEVPNLFHGSMSDCAGRPAGTEFEVGHSTSLEAQEDPDIRAVRSDVVSCHWEPFGLELHPSPPSDPRCPSRLGILP